MPAITVGIPVYNGEAYIAETLRSLLSQTFRDFELLVVDDGSTDGTAGIVESFAAQDARVCLHRNGHNKGVGYTANRLFDLAKGKYLARADADDVYMPDRLERQWNLMESDPATAACGGAMQYAGAASGVLSLPEQHDVIKCHMMFYTAIAQPVVMLRTEFFRANNLRYNPAFRTAEDYDLWQRILHDHGGRVANLPQVLVHYRVHSASITNSQKRLTQDMAATVWNRVLRGLLPDVSDEELALHRAVCFGPAPRGREEVAAVQAWLRRLLAMNEARGVFAPGPWSGLLAYKLFQTVQVNLDLGPGVCRELIAFPGFNMLGLGENEIKMMLEKAVRMRAAA